MRGEDKIGHISIYFDMETPPRAWGRPILWDDKDGEDRNTPTCVGKTVCTLCTLGIFQKHPHVRGEDTNIL